MHAYLITGKDKDQRLQKASELIAQKGIAEKLLLVPEGKITIEQARDLKTKLSYAPTYPKMGRAVLVEEANLFTQEAANAILKTLEEPAGNTLFILTAQNEDQVIETLRSRCQLLNLGACQHRDIDQTQDKLDKLVSSKVSARLEFLETIKDREGAKALCESLLFAAHRKLLTAPSANTFHLAKNLLRARQDLEDNVNVKLLLGDLFLNF